MTTKRIVGFARWLEELSSGFLATVITTETGEDYRDRDMLDQATRVIEIFGVAGTAKIVGCD